MRILGNLEKRLRQEADPEKAKILQRFFKTGPGEYGEGDIFLGVTLPQQRKIAREFFQNIGFGDIQNLMASKVHEKRVVALLLLMEKYRRSEDVEKQRIVDFYLKNTKNINNWDLVDLSSHVILGNFLLKRERKILYVLARSQNMWERRIAIISTFEFIRNHEFEDALNICEILLGDRHDLIHKAAGWMLREIGKRNQNKEEEFLKKFAHRMPRTMLRYSLERFSMAKKERYMAAKFDSKTSKNGLKGP